MEAWKKESPDSDLSLPDSSLCASSGPILLLSSFPATASPPCDQETDTSGLQSSPSAKGGDEGKQRPGCQSEDTWALEESHCTALSFK